MEKIFSFAWRGKRGMPEESKEEGKEGKPQDNYVNDEQGLQRRHNVDTLLQVEMSYLIFSVPHHVEYFHPLDLYPIF